MKLIRRATQLMPARAEQLENCPARRALKLALAERMERLKEWDKSADVYQEIVEKYADRVVPNQADAAGVAKRYSSVTLEVQRRMARWPDEGMRAYKARFEPPAAQMLESA